MKKDIVLLLILLSLRDHARKTHHRLTRLRIDSPDSQTSEQTADGGILSLWPTAL